MTKITQEEVLKLAHMSQINISQEEIPALLETMDAVLTYASCLKEIIANETQSAMPRNTNIMRDDKVVKTEAEPLLAQAPAREENYFVVPKILKS